MRTLIGLMMLGTTAAAAEEAPVRVALKKVGPAYMCGANYEYVEALDGLRRELERAGLSGFMIDAAMESVRRVAESNADDRLTLTADDCAKKYGR